MNLTERFLKYVSMDTQSDSKSRRTPSTDGQMAFAQSLAAELRQIGLHDVETDGNACVMASLPASQGLENIPVVGFIAHIDTSPDMSGSSVKPRIVPRYDGGDIILNAEKNIILSPKDFPELHLYIGQDIIVTDGTTLLGADDKAGMAEIVSAMEYLLAHPEIRHGKLRIAFTPDEEIGEGAHHFDVKKFAADWAYTIDGGQIGELEYENFNAAAADITFFGRNVHPGYAKRKMHNSMLTANRFIAMLPDNETPEKTEGYEGFYHLTGMEATVEKTTLHYIIRDHSRERFEQRKKEMQRLAGEISVETDSHSVEIEIRDQYYNMREKIEPCFYIVDLAKSAMQELGIEPLIKPIRGGTDGAQLSFKGLPCPNIFAGGHNFHGRFEFIPIPSMQKAVELIVKIAEKAAEIENKQ